MLVSDKYSVFDLERNTHRYTRRSDVLCRINVITIGLYRITLFSNHRAERKREFIISLMKNLKTQTQMFKPKLQRNVASLSNVKDRKRVFILLNFRG